MRAWKIPVLPRQNTSRQGAALSAGEGWGTQCVEIGGSGPSAFGVNVYRWECVIPKLGAFQSSESLPRATDGEAERSRTGIFRGSPVARESVRLGDQRVVTARRIPRPAGESAGLRVTHVGDRKFTREQEDARHAAIAAKSKSLLCALLRSPFVFENREEWGGVG